MTSSLGLKKRYGGRALITGAARGIGEAFALLLAEEGFDLLLVDCEEAENEALAEALRKDRGIDARSLVCDLTRPDLPEQAQRWCEDYEVGLLINNAGISQLDPFLDVPLETHLRTLDLNCRATLILTHVMGGAMASRNRGGIVVVSSASALSGSPYFCNYAATKGYGLNLACGLWSELNAQGVDVLAVCPGMTDTAPVRDRGLHEGLPFYIPVTEPRAVAGAALEALGKGPVVVPTWADRLSTGLLSKLAPRAWALSIMKRSIDRMRA